MPTQPAWVISNEILECAKQCIVADDPKECARQFGDELLARGWVQADVDEVLKDAANIVEQASSGN